jgi:transposase-like protein
VHQTPCDSSKAAYECSVGEGTAINYYKIFRGICVDLSVGSDRIGGPGTIVEIDEMKLGKRKFHRGKRVDGQWCFGGIVRREDKSHPIKCFVIPVEDRSANTLIPIILDNIEDGTTIYSDCWKAYDCLEDKGFKHLSVNHSLHFKDPETGVHTNTVEGMWNQIRRSLPKFGTKKENYHAYLAEYIIRNSLRNVTFFDFILENLHRLILWE